MGALCAATVALWVLWVMTLAGQKMNSADMPVGLFSIAEGTTFVWAPQNRSRPHLRGPVALVACPLGLGLKRGFCDGKKKNKP